MLGWQPVRVEQLADAEQLGGFETNAAGEVVRGERGQERLMYMRKDVFEQIQRAKTARNMQGMGNAAATRADIVNRAGSELGAEAADKLNTGLIGRVVDGKEMISRTDPEE